MSDMQDNAHEGATLEIPATSSAFGDVAREVARLVVLTGVDAGRRLTFRKSLVVGRSPDVGLTLRDSSASREHLRITRTPAGTWMVEDLASTNGTLHNDAPLKALTELRFGDRLSVGDSLLLFTHVDPLEDRIAQREKLEIVGRLAAGITHDLNNLLSVIGASAEHATLLMDDGEVSGPGAGALRECLDDVCAATKRSGELTRHLLDFARRDAPEIGVVDISALATEALALAERTFRAGIVVTRKVEARLFVSGNRGQLHQVLMNLMLNARDAMPDGGTLTLVVSQGRDADHVRVRVEDTGRGMDAETRERLFTPFFTTKPKGHGLGLATAHAVITAHGGAIDCESQPGHGTAFILHLPRADAPAERSRTTAPVVDRAHPAARLATVLVVDDDAAVRRAIARALRQAGHRPLEAANARDAMAALRASDRAIDVMVLDLDLPDLDAQSMLLVLAGEGITVPTVIVSGRVDDDQASRLMKQGVRQVLSKPFGGAALLDAIAECTARPTGAAQEP